jgi:hypothetical protein
MLSHNDEMEKAPVDLDAESDNGRWFMMTEPNCTGRRIWSSSLEGRGFCSTIRLDRWTGLIPFILFLFFMIFLASRILFFALC